MSDFAYKERLVEDGNIIDLYLSTNGRMSFWLDGGERSVFVDAEYDNERDHTLQLTICKKGEKERSLRMKGTFGSDGEGGTFAPYVGTGVKGAFIIIPEFKGRATLIMGFDEVAGRSMKDCDFTVNIDAHLLNYKGSIEVSATQ